MCYIKKCVCLYAKRQGFSFEYARQLALCFNILIHIVCNSSSKVYNLVSCRKNNEF